ncbi:hypothetical protein BGZ58_003817 [Dissophora ornata]|nr:hypothetical protein BGZ58_003817 [Dissophora ornata]
MTTVGSLARDIAPGNDVAGKSTLNLPPSPSNSVPFINIGASKLDMEPNPFEQSFAGTGSQKSGSSNGNSEPAAVETPRPVLPPIEAMSGRLAPGADQFGWDAQSLRMGPLSPSMLEGPQNPIVFDEKSTQNPLPVGSFPSTSAIFTSVTPLAENGLPFVGGPLPAPQPAAESYQPGAFNSSHTMSQQQQQASQHQGGPQAGAGSRSSQSYTNPSSHPPMNDRYIPPQASQHPDNMNGYGNLHLLSQAQPIHREMWIKRENAESNGSVPHGQHPHPHGSSSMASQNRSNHPPQPGPPTSGQSLPAALKCRQRKKQWLANLQTKVEYLTTDNEHLQSQAATLRDEIIRLKALLLAHKDCPVAQANGVYADTVGMPNHGGMMGHDRSGYSMQQHQQGVPQQGRGGPAPPRGPPPMGHHHGPMPGGSRMANQPGSSSAPGGPMPASANGRPMSMMQDITPGASPSQGQANVRYLDGCLVLAYSLRKVRSRYPLVVMVPASPPLQPSDLDQLAKVSNIVIHPIDVSFWKPPKAASPSLQSSSSDKEDGDEYLWDYYYKRLVLMDCDMLVRINMDQLLNERPTLTAITSQQDADVNDDRKVQLGYGDAYLDLPEDWVAAAHACTCNPMQNPKYPASW